MPLYNPTVASTIVLVPPSVQTFTSGSAATYNKNYTFIITSGSATVGATYTNNAITYTVYATVASATQVVMSGSGAPLSSGTLTKSGGTGDSTLSFSQVVAPLYLKVRMVGAGGGGAGSGTAAGTAAVDGGATLFGSSLLTANGGVKGGASAGGGAGGTASVALPAHGTAFTGAQGQGTSWINTVAVIWNGAGGAGGASFFGGGGSGTYGTAGTAGATNSGSGGAGGGAATTAQMLAGGGGGAGGYVEAVIASPSATYTYTIGASGAGGGAGTGTGATAGGAGAAGYIEVVEYYC